MKQELNIAAILKDKPRGTRLWSPALGEVRYDCISKYTSYPVYVKYGVNGNGFGFKESGKIEEDGEPMLFPSKGMRDWSKFAWKKGDVIRSICGSLSIFDDWASDDYTAFYVRYYGKDYNDEKLEILNIETWSKVTNETTIKQYISKIEEINGGKLNLETLEIEHKTKQEFKDGDICYMERDKVIFIFKKMEGYVISYYASYSTRLDVVYIDDVLSDSEIEHYSTRPATDSEKQLLFDALAKENKAWDAEKKAIVDLPKKCEFKPLDYVLVKSKEKHSLWNLYQFAFKGINLYCMVGNICLNRIDYNFLPYNDSTKHLLGTTEDWEGGEV